jgi:hypothetical protein
MRRIRLAGESMELSPSLHSIFPVSSCKTETVVVDLTLYESIRVGSVLPIDPGLGVEERDN